ncbi:MAG: hypothetical protein QM765_28440 [Myxococcales bacterium]
MSSIGKRINDVLPGLANAKVLKSREYEMKWDSGAPTGVKVREQELDLDGDGQTDVRAERRTDLKTGRFDDSFEVTNSTRVNHDKVLFHTDANGVVRAEYFNDRLPNGQIGRQVNLGDTNKDGKVDYKSVHLPDGQYFERDDSDGDGQIDRERSIDAQGKVSEKKLITDSFFEDEN